MLLNYFFTPLPMVPKYLTLTYLFKVEVSNHALALDLALALVLALVKQATQTPNKRPSLMALVLNYFYWNHLNQGTVYTITI